MHSLALCSLHTHPLTACMAPPAPSEPPPTGSFAPTLAHTRLALLCFVNLNAASTILYLCDLTPLHLLGGTHAHTQLYHDSPTLDIHSIAGLAEKLASGTHIFLQIWDVHETHRPSIAGLGPAWIFGWNNELLRIILGSYFIFEIQKHIHNISCLSLNQLEPEAIKKRETKKAPPGQSSAGQMLNSPKQGRDAIHI